MKVLIDIKQVDNTAIVEDTKSTNQQHICIVHQSSSTSTFFAHNQSHFSAVFMNELTLVVSTNHTTKPYAILSCNVQFCLIQYNSIKSFIFSILQYPTLSSNRQAPLVSRCLGFSSSDKFLPKTVWKRTLINLHKPTRVHKNLLECTQTDKNYHDARTQTSKTRDRTAQDSSRQKVMAIVYTAMPQKRPKLRLHFHLANHFLLVSANPAKIKSIHTQCTMGSCINYAIADGLVGPSK